MTVTFEPEHLDFGRSLAGICERLQPGVSVLGPAGAAGFLGMEVPEDLGGGGVDDPLFLATGIAELCRLGRIGAAVGYAVQAGVVLPILLAHAGAEVAKRTVPDLASGQDCVGLVFSGIEATAIDGGWRLAGAASAVINAARSRHLLVAFGTDDGLRVGLVDRAQHGVDVGEPGARALEGAGIASATLDAVLLEESRVLELGAHRDLVAGLRLWLSVVALHGARHALDLTTSYVRDRKVFGQPLSELDNTRSVLGRLAADLEQAKHAVEWGLSRCKDGGLSATEAAPLVLAATETFRAAADAGLQLHGGYGYMREYPISGAFADAQLLLLLGSATEPLSDLADLALRGAGT
jgi:acyl-CoA dehydrogenase